MSPRPLDPDVIRRRLHEIDRLLGWLRDLGTPDAQTLRDEWRTRLLVERILEQLVELAVGINLHISGAAGVSSGDSYRDSFAALGRVGVLEEGLAAQLAPSAGLRNALVHDYLDVDYDIVAAAIPVAAAQYDQYRQQVSRWVDRQVADGG